MNHQLALFYEENLTIGGCEIEIPFISLKENENNYPEKYLASYKGKPFLHLTILESEENGEFVISWTSLDKKQSFFGGLNKMLVNWMLADFILKAMK